MSRPTWYEIRIGCYLGSSSAAAFETLTIGREAGGVTVLRGCLPDQAALHGILMRIRDLGLPLIEVRQVVSDPHAADQGVNIMQKIAILGGTGMLGTPVVHQMLADGFALRLLARDPQKVRTLFGDAVDVAAGDVTDATAVERALAGCDGVYVGVGGPDDQVSAEHAAAAARALGLQRIIYVSGSTVSDTNAWFPMTAQKVAAETAVRQSGVPYTILCPTWPMEQLPRFVVNGRATVVGVLPEPWHWFAAADMARMVSNAFRSTKAANRRLFIHGPEAVTIAEALERYRQAVHPEIDAVAVLPIAAARQLAEATNNRFLGMFAELMAYFQQTGEPGDPTEANALLGQPTTTLDAWIAQQVGVATAED